VDNFLNQVSSNDFDLTDINKVKEALGFVAKLEVARLQDEIETTKLKRQQLEKEKITFIAGKEIPGYLG
jgi:hypothetical protein